MALKAASPEQRSELGAALDELLAEFSVDQESAFGIAGQRVVVENHIKPFPWIFRK
jgi:hypothetical protein